MPRFLVSFLHRCIHIDLIANYVQVDHLRASIKIIFVKKQIIKNVALGHAMFINISLYIAPIL